jgi:hypothetical protein
MILKENYRPDILFVRTSARVRIYPADAVLPEDRFLTSADAKKKKAWKERDYFQFSIFNFRISILKIPKIPELLGLRGRSRKKKVFSAYFP